MTPIVQKTIQQLRKKSLSKEERVALVTALLDTLGAFPIGDMVVETPEGLIINGKELDIEQSIAFREACVSLKENFARKVLNEQLKYKALQLGIEKAVTLDELFFSKAIIWIINEENILLQKLTASS